MPYTLDPTKCSCVDNLSCSNLFGNIWYNPADPKCGKVSIKLALRVTGTAIELRSLTDNSAESPITGLSSTLFNRTIDGEACQGTVKWKDSVFSTVPWSYETFDISKAAPY